MNDTINENNDNNDTNTEPTTETKNRSGYVALLGRTNVGKSTFLNAIMEAKISIVSNKPQTTRKQILGIKTSEKGQIVFFDSPGIHKPHFRLNVKMMQEVQASVMDADLILYFIDLTDRRPDDFALSMLKEPSKPVILVINKIDKMKKSNVLTKIATYKDVHPWAEIVPLSALTGVNVELLEELIFNYLPEGENFFPDDEYTQQTEKFYISEMVREKLLELTKDELPFTTTVKVEEITQRDEKLNYIRAEIYVESKSQKKIVVGKQGGLIKQIGEMARKDVEEYYEKKIYLELFVKVVPGWRNSPHILSEIDG